MCTGMAQVTSSHTSTAEWQSFEVRMRRRRVERCLIRARIALQQQMMALQAMAAMQGGGQPQQPGAGPQRQQQGPKTMPANRQRLMNQAPVTDNFAPARR